MIELLSSQHLSFNILGLVNWSAAEIKKVRNLRTSGLTTQQGALVKVLMSGRHKDIHLSKTLCWLLRHGAVKEHLAISPEGYMNVEDLLNHKSLKNKFTVDDIKRVVETSEKQRFTLRCRNNILQICANQGHSLREVDDITLVPILSSEDLTVIHGTFYKNWINIQKEGISRMKRNHIHFAADLPHNKSVISGVRSNAQVFIYINLELALSDSIEFYMSVNGVILSPGNDRGYIEPKYFSRVSDINGKSLL
ncbi:hypothetical protein NQ318_003035 [Aromia moschata]|uniref:2'-phosphotransferase n=1 Tax=Aromia moschata TaxID=1265417 RepID=A0AAV8YRT4_9CUCU|nr:hypothetical protein NQ318_003035 [Aromia moschata]